MAYFFDLNIDWLKCVKIDPVAESFLMYDEDIEHLHEQQIAGSLALHFKTIMSRHHDSVLKKLAQHYDGALKALIDRNPALSEDNVGYLIYRGSEYSRVLAIYNLRRMVDFVQKRQLNPNASGEDGLLHKPWALGFHVARGPSRPGLPACRARWNNACSVFICEVVTRIIPNSAASPINI